MGGTLFTTSSIPLIYIALANSFVVAKVNSKVLCFPLEVDTGSCFCLQDG